MSEGTAKVAHLNLAKDFGGGERQTWLLMSELAKRGWDQRLVASQQSVLADRAADSVSGLEIIRTANNPVAWIGATRACRITHAHEARAVYIGLLAHWFHHSKGVITRRVPNPLKQSWLRDRAYGAASAITTVSSIIGDSLRVQYPSLKTITIHSAQAQFPVDAIEAAAIRSRYPGKCLIGHTGSYRHRSKGQLTIIEVARRAAKNHPDWHFLLMGSGEDETIFRAAIGELSNIELTGFVTNVGDYLAACDLFILPSLVEGLGSSLLDAMQFGLPIVATRVGGIPEVMQDGVNGILIEPEAPEQLYAGLERLAADTPDVKAMRQANRERALLFTAEHMADAYETLYREILA